MNVTIEIPEEIGREMRRRAIAAGRDLAAFIGQIVVESAETPLEHRPNPQHAADFERRLDAWTALHPRLDHAIDDSRESFYTGRE